ncbi:GNAT family N-acetyltransferase [Maribacter sp. 2308TA10-17]|uniref:GNAT family N-acetyltransferase n=1 Tax=Maribacter sp. 2308TA10-17 TaxID=3386276 RepID=UPI0039BD2DA7
MINLLRTDSKNPDFISLVAQLDADLGARDGDEHAFYHQFNSIDNLNHVVVLYKNEIPVGCGAIKTFDDTSMEVKRMYVPPTERGKRYATKILDALEQWVFELGNTRCVLETGKRQPEAIALYEKNGYRRIANYGQYIGIENSVCFEKKL